MATKLKERRQSFAVFVLNYFLNFMQRKQLSPTNKLSMNNLRNTKVMFRHGNPLLRLDVMASRNVT